MRLPHAAHTDRPWRVHEIAPDFEVEDVWGLPVEGGRDDLPRLVETVFDSDFPDASPLPVRAMWEARWRIGRLLRWDDPGRGTAGRVTSLREQLPVDLPALPDEGRVQPFTAVYGLEDEWVAELANRTVHTLMHLGWIEQPDGTYRGQMAVLVRPNGALGSLYMSAIRPLRLLVVYPALLRSIERGWRSTEHLPVAAAPERPGWRTTARVMGLARAREGKSVRRRR